MVIIDFEISKDGHTFKDAIHLPENHGLTDAEIEAIKEKRFNDWYTIVTTIEAEPEE
jgi:hypothetical protein